MGGLGGLGVLDVIQRVLDVFWGGWLGVFCGGLVVGV